MSFVSETYALMPQKPDVVLAPTAMVSGTVLMQGSLLWSSPYILVVLTNVALTTRLYNLCYQA